jgi:ABC-type glycerol-3-phosphate transport system permease component
MTITALYYPPSGAQVRSSDATRKARLLTLYLPWLLSSLRCFPSRTLALAAGRGGCGPAAYRRAAGLTVELPRPVGFTRFDRFFLNSLFVAGAPRSSPSGIDPLGLRFRFRFKGKTVIFFSIWPSDDSPGHDRDPAVRILIVLGLARSRLALVGTYTTFMITFCTLLMKGSWMPSDRDRRIAAIDGCSRRGLFRIVLLIKPG